LIIAFLPVSSYFALAGQRPRAHQYVTSKKYRGLVSVDSIKVLEPEDAVIKSRLK